MSSQQALQQRLSEFRVDGIPFGDVISMLSQASGANFHIRWKQLEPIGVSRETPVSVDLHNTTLAKTLDVILESVEPADIKLGYYVHENVITVYISRSQHTNLVTRVYDVTDMMFQIPDIDPADYTGNSGGSSSSNSGNSNGNGRGSGNSSTGGSGRGSRMGQN